MGKKPHTPENGRKPHPALPHRRSPLRLFFKNTLAVIFSVAIFFVALEISLWAFSAVSLILRHNSMNVAASGSNGSFRIMCIGESTTAMGGANSYPAQLEQVLNSSSRGRTFTVINNGLIASNSSNIAARLENDIERYRPDMIVAMIGINDTPAASPAKGEYAPRPAWSRSRSFRLISAFIQNMIDKNRRAKALRLDSHAQDAKGAPRGNIEACLASGWRARQAHRDSEAKKDFVAAIEYDPSDVRAYFALGWLLQDEGKNAEAEEFFTKAIRRNPLRAGSYVGMGWFLQTPKRAHEAEEAFLNTIKSGQDTYSASVGLGWLLKFQGRNEDAETVFNKALSYDPGRIQAYVGLAMIYSSSNRVREAEDLLKKAGTLQKESQEFSEVGYPTDAYLELAWLYKNTGKRAEAREAFLKAIEASLPGGKTAEKAYGGLFIMDVEDGINDGEAAASLSLFRNTLSPVTRENYLRIKEIAEKNDIRLVCVQYPMRTIRPLQQALGTDRGIIFVENMSNFEEAVRRYGYNSCFWDPFGGDFGHCTRLGNRLIAENAAKSILKALGEEK